MSTNSKNLDFNSTEEKVVRLLKQAKGPVHLADIAKAFANVRRKTGRKQKGLTPEQRNSWARNGLRRLVKFRLVKQVDRGTYEFIGSKGKPKKKLAAKKVNKPVQKEAPKQAAEATEASKAEATQATA